MDTRWGHLCEFLPLDPSQLFQMTTPFSAGRSGSPLVPLRGQWVCYVRVAYGNKEGGFKLAFVLGSTSEFQALQPVLYISCHWEVCMGSPRLPSGLMICLKDSQNSEKLLYSQVQFLRAKGYCKGNQQRKKVYRMEFRRNQVWASSHPHPMELHGYHSIPPAVMHDNTHEVLPAWALVSRVWGVSHIGIECPCNWP